MALGPGLSLVQRVADKRGSWKLQELKKKRASFAWGAGFGSVHFPNLRVRKEKDDNGSFRRYMSSIRGRWFALTPLNLVLAGVMLIQLFLYKPLTGWAAQLSIEPLIEALPIDYQLPFVPEMIIPYLSMYVLLGFTVVVLVFRQDRFGLSAYLLGLVIYLSVSNLLYWLMPNADVLHPADADLGTGLFSDLVRESYGGLPPYGTFPSGHNGIAGLAAVTWLYMRTRWAWVGVIWGATICVSTWLVKQHYVLDTLSSVPLAVVSYLVARSALRRSS